MATATKQKPTKAAFIEVPVNFGNVSVGDRTARLGVMIDREDAELTIEKADRSICGCRLTGKIVARASGAHGDQEPIPGMDAGDMVLEGSFDVKSIGVTPKTITLGLTFVLKDLDVGELAHFAKRAGKLIVHASEEIVVESDEDEGDEE